LKKINILLCIMYIHYLSLSFLLLEMIKYILFTLTESSILFLGLDLSIIDDYYSKKIFVFSFIVFLFFTSIYLALLIINYISLDNEYKNKDIELLCKKVTRIKIGFFPFWIINIVLIVFIVFRMQLIVSPLTEIFIYYNLDIWYHLWVYCIYLSNRYFEIFLFLFINLIFTSVFSITLIKLMHKNNIIQKKYFLKHIIMQLLFIIDIFAIIQTINKWRKSNIA
jgi:hypothetical protein